MVTLEHHIENDIAVIQVAGPLDGTPAANRIHEKVKDLLREGHRKIVLDLEEVPWMNSLGVGVIVAAYTSCRNAEAEIRICRATERVGRMLEVIQVIPWVFKNYASLAEARQSLD